MGAKKTVNRNKTIWLLQVCNSVVSKPAATLWHQKPANKSLCTGRNKVCKNLKLKCKLNKTKYLWTNMMQ